MEKLQNSKKEVKCYIFNFCVVLVGHDIATDTGKTTLWRHKFNAPSLKKTT